MRHEVHVELVMVDNGSGMDPERLKRALHGGFSSKANGTGLGLSICRHLMGTHGATMNVDSTTGKGTTIRVDVSRCAAGMKRRRVKITGLASSLRRGLERKPFSGAFSTRSATSGR